MDPWPDSDDEILRDDDLDLISRVMGPGAVSSHKKVRLKEAEALVDLRDAQAKEQEADTALKAAQLAEREARVILQAVKKDVLAASENAVWATVLMDIHKKTQEAARERAINMEVAAKKAELDASLAHEQLETAQLALDTAQFETELLSTTKGVMNALGMLILAIFTALCLPLVTPLLVAATSRISRNTTTYQNLEQIWGDALENAYYAPTP